VQITAPVVPVVSNVTAAPVSDPAEIRLLLVQQITGAVRWRESVLAMEAAGVRAFWEIGAGKALSGMIRRIAREADLANVATPADVLALRKVFGAE